MTALDRSDGPTSGAATDTMTNLPSPFSPSRPPRSMTTEPLTVMSAEQLWQRARDGDRGAFGQIVERYQSLICALAYCACGDLAGAEDLAQETFIAAWGKLAELRDPARLRAWLCGIVRNLAAGELRRELR